eukprot:tig00000572_g2208.t1
MEQPVALAADPSVHIRPSSTPNVMSFQLRDSPAPPLGVEYVEPMPTFTEKGVAAAAAEKGDGRKTDQKKDATEERKKPDPDKMVSFSSLLFRFATPTDKLIMLLGAVGAVANGGALPAFAIIFGEMMNSLNSADIEGQVGYYAKVFVLLGVGLFFASWLETGLWMINSERQSRRIRTALLKSMLRQEVAWFDGHKPGELSSRINADVKLIQDAIGEKVGSAIHHNATFVAGMAVGFAKGWHLALLIMGVIPFLGACGAVMAKLVSQASQSGQGAYAKAGDVADEAITSVRTVVSHCGEKREQERYRENLQEARRFGMKKGLSAGMSVGAMMLVMFCTYGLAFWFGSWLIQHEVWNPARGGIYTGGDIMTVLFAIVMGAFGVGQAAPSFPVIADGRGAAFTVWAICDRKSSIDVFEGSGESLPSLTGDIDFRGVEFTYPTRADVPILRGASLSVRRGETVALVGHSGCGKSTCMQLVLRYYDPAAGAVTVDGRDLKQLNVRWWRSQIGLVGQEPVLFATSIAENIRMGKEDATMDEIVAACKAANAHDFISKMPKGYDTYVGDIGAQLSGGQKQRIAIARALIKNPRILLLDEATSALDTQSERVVQEALDRLMRGRTTIVIAHRLSTIQKADRIYVFEAGAVAEEGTHEALMARGGLYAGLVHAQSAKKDEERDTKAMEAAGPQGDPDALLPAPAAAALALPGAQSLGPDSPAEKEDAEGEGGKKKGKAEKIAVPWGRVMRSVSGKWWLLLLGALGGLGNGTVMPIFAVLFSEILAVFFKPWSGETEGEARFWSLMFVAIGGAIFAFTLTKIACFDIVGEHLTYRLRLDTFRAILRQEIAWFDEEKNSARIVTTNLQTDASLVQGATTARLGMMCELVSTVTTGLVIAFVSGWKLALVTLAVAPTIAFSEVLQFKFMTGFSAGRNAYEQAGKLAGDTVANIRTVASFVSEQRLLGAYDALLATPQRAGVKKAHVSGISFGLSQFCNFAAQAFIFWYGARLIANGEMNFMNMIRTMMAIVMTAMGAGQIHSLAPDYEKAVAACGKIFGLLDRVPGIDSESEAGERLQVERGELTLHNVHFRYPTRPGVPILRGLDLTVPAGKTLALVGPSGCGKSTVMQLAQRFYDPEQGAVLVDGRDLRTLHVKHLRQQVGIVAQEPVLFAASIRDNIRYGRPEASDGEVEQAARAANIHDFIASLPAGYETYVGTRGSQLSGGQKQRIAIARAVLKNPRILLLDEATSALDTQSERVVQEALDRVMQGRTTVVVAHRLSTVRNAHLIAFIREGRVAEAGTHEELVARNGHYAQCPFCSCQPRMAACSRSGVFGDRVEGLGRPRARFAFVCALAAVGLLLQCRTALAECEFADGPGPEGTSALDLYPAALTPVTSRSGTITGSELGVQALAAGSCSCKDRLDCWSDYVQFKSGDSEESLSRTLIRFDLPYLKDDDFDALGDAELAVKFRGPDGGWIAWRWDVQDQITKEWVLLGNNSGISWPDSWVWTTFNFKQGGAARFVDRSGAKPAIQVRQSCTTTRPDAMNIDFMRLRVQLRSAGSGILINGTSASQATGGIALDRPARNAGLPKVLVGDDGLGVVLFRSTEGCPSTAYLSVAHCSDKNCTSFDSERMVFSYRFSIFRALQFDPDFAIGSDGFPIIAVSPDTGLRFIHCLDYSCENTETRNFAEVPATQGTVLRSNVALSVGGDGLPIIAVARTSELVFCLTLSCERAVTAPFRLPGFPPTYKPDVAVPSDGNPVVLYSSGTNGYYETDQFVNIARCRDRRCSAFDVGPELGAPVGPLLVVPSTGAGATSTLLVFKVVRRQLPPPSGSPSASDVPQYESAIQVADCAGASCTGPLAFRDIFSIATAGNEPGVSPSSLSAALSPAGRPLLAFAVGTTVYQAECADAVCTSAESKPVVERPCATALDQVSIASLGDVTLVAYTQGERARTPASIENLKSNLDRIGSRSRFAADAQDPLLAGKDMEAFSRLYIAKLPRYTRLACARVDYP